MPKAEIVIGNRLGLHARPSAELVRLAGRYECNIMISNGEKTVNAKSIMSVMTLAASQGRVLTLETLGIDAEDALVALVELFTSNFGEQS